MVRPSGRLSTIFIDFEMQHPSANAMITAGADEDKMSDSTGNQK